MLLDADNLLYSRITAQNSHTTHIMLSHWYISLFSVPQLFLQCFADLQLLCTPLALLAGIPAEAFHFSHLVSSLSTCTRVFIILIFNFGFLEKHSMDTQAGLCTWGNTRLETLCTGSRTW